jgi:hypothetical protein
MPLISKPEKNPPSKLLLCFIFRCNQIKDADIHIFKALGMVEFLNSGKTISLSEYRTVEIGNHEPCPHEHAICTGD